MDNLDNIEHFFEIDNEIKKAMYDSAPPSENECLDNDSICKYTNDLDIALKYIFRELKEVSTSLFGEESKVSKKILSFEEKTKNDFYNSGLDIAKLRNFYKDNISNMEPSFIDEVKENCVGYKLFKSFPIDKASSINEILHLIHSYILNNESVLQRINLIESKDNLNGETINLRGINNPIFEEMYSKFPVSLNVGTTDIVVVNDKKAIMMIRDLGHALSLEISLDNDMARIEYFIPKICNIEMVNNLPGINKVNPNSVGATGTFETPVSEMTNKLYEFLSKVPTDSDITTQAYKQY